jgi:hypothetical protein
VWNLPYITVLTPIISVVASRFLKDMCVSVLESISTTRRRIPNYCDLDTYCRSNLKSHPGSVFFLWCEKPSFSPIQHVRFYFVLFIPWIIDNRFTLLHHQNAQTFSLDYVSHLIFLHVSVRNGPSSGNQTKVIQHKTKLVTFVYSWHGVEDSNGADCR